jgi:glycosyltransferase 2 family protein
VKQTLWNLLKLVIGLGLLLFLYSRLENPGALWRQIVEADKARLAIGAACYAGAVGLSALKWGLLLRAAGIEVRTRRLLRYQWMAEFFNNFLPAQVGGDVMRGYAVASDTRRAAVAAASVLIDRFLGLAVFMLGAVIASGSLLIWGRPNDVPFAPDQLWWVQRIALGSGLFSLALLTALVAFLSRRLQELAERILARLPLARRTVPLWQKAATAFAIYRRKPAVLGWAAAGSALIVVLTSINIWLIAQAIAPGSISLLEVLTINPIIVFVALMLPLSPGGLGVRQGAFHATFLLLGVGGELGFAVGLIQQFIGYGVSLPGGYLWVRGRGRQPAPLPIQPAVRES